MQNLCFACTLIFEASHAHPWIIFVPHQKKNNVVIRDDNVLNLIRPKQEPDL